MSGFSSRSHKIDLSSYAAPLHIKFALFCLTKMKVPKWIAYFCFAISQVQAIAIIIKSAYVAFSDNNPSVSPVIKALLKFFVLGDWIDSANPNLLLAVNSIITLYVLKMLGLMIYIYLSLAQKWKIPGIIQCYWSTMHSLHPSLVFFWIHTFSIGVINSPPQYHDVHGVSVSLTSMAYINDIINCTLAIFFSIISVRYKTKDALSSKTNILETKSIIFKILIPILWKTAEDSQGAQIVILGLALIHALLHDWMLITYLPYYRITLLLLSSRLQGIQTSGALVCFIIKLVETGKANLGIISVLMVWLLTGPVLVKTYSLYMWRILLYICGCDTKNEKNVYHLTHKRFILKHFLKPKIAIFDSRIQLLDAGIIAEECTSELELPQDKDQIVTKKICQEILNNHPRSLLAQINLADIYSKFENLHLVANNILQDAIAKGPGYHAQISLNMVSFALQKKLTGQFSQQAGAGEQQTESLNVYNYLVNQELHEKVKESIGKQAKLQSSFWKEFLSRRPSMLNLMNLALKVNSQRQIVKKLWNNLSKIRSKSFLSPLRVYGMYSSLVNNNSIEAEKYLKQSQEDTKRMNKFFKIDELNNQTIFSDKTVKITMSGLRSKLGRIIDCSSNIANFYGWQASEMKGRSIGSLMPPFYRQRHDGFLLHHFNTGKTRTLHKTGVYPMKRSNGFIHPTWLHTKISPVMDNGIFYLGILRPCKSSLRMVLVKRDGKIDDMSFEFVKEMNLLKSEGQSELDILSLCPDFKQINEAFNTIADYSVGKAIPPETQNSLPQSSQLDRNQSNPTERLTSYQEDTARNTERPLISGGHLTIDRSPLRQTSFPKNAPSSDSPGLLISPQASSPAERLITTQEDTERPLISRRNKQLIIAMDKSPLMQPKMERFDTDKSLKFAEPKSATRSIYDNFMAGSTLIFHPRKNYVMVPAPGSPKNRRKSVRLLQSEPIPVAYSVRVMNSIHGNEVLKFIFLERISGKEDHFHEKSMTDSSDHEAGVPSLSSLGSEEIKKPAIQPQGLGVVGALKAPDLTMDGADLSILDEIRSNDFVAKKTLQRNILDGGSWTNRKNVDISPKESYVFQEEDGVKVKSQALQAVDFPYHHQHQKEYGGSLSGIIQGRKIEELMIQALKVKPTKRSAKVYAVLFFLLFIYTIVLLGAQSVNLSNGIKGVQSQVPVISAAFFRQYSMVSSATQIRILIEILEGRFTMIDFATDTWIFNTYLKEYIDDLLNYNGKFYELLTELPVNIQTEFHKKTVRFYDYNKDGTNTLFSQTSPFEALQMLIERETRCYYMPLPDQWEAGIDTSNHKFIIHNILNDSLVQSQSQIDQLAANLDDSLGSTTLKMGLTLGCVGIVCFIFILISIRYVCLLASEARIFMTMIFRLKPHDCEVLTQTLENFRIWLETDNTKNQEDIFVQQEQIKEQIKEQENHHSSPTRFRRASMSSLYRSQRIAFYKLFPFFLLFVGWSVAYFFMTYNFIGDIKDSEKRMEAALQALNNQTLYVNEMMSVPLSNMTALIKNQPLKPNVDETMQYLRDIDVFVDKFRDRKGELTPLQKKVLFGFPCEDFLPYLKDNYLDYIYAYDSCYVIGKGTDSVGLVNINSELYDVGLNVLASYEESSKTVDELENIFLVGLTRANDYVNSAEGFLKMLYRATYQSFEDEVDSIKKSSLALAVSIIICTVIAIVIAWRFVIMKIFNIGKVDWYMLQIIPIQLILSNKHLQQYLLKRSNGMLDSVKNVLS